MTTMARTTTATRAWASVMHDDKGAGLRGPQQQRRRPRTTTTTRAWAHGATTTTITMMRVRISGDYDDEGSGLGLQQQQRRLRTTTRTMAWASVAHGAIRATFTTTRVGASDDHNSEGANLGRPRRPGHGFQTTTVTIVVPTVIADLWGDFVSCFFSALSTTYVQRALCVFNDKIIPPEQCLCIMHWDNADYYLLTAISDTCILNNEGFLSCTHMSSFH